MHYLPFFLNHVALSVFCFLGVDRVKGTDKYFSTFNHITDNNNDKYQLSLDLDARKRVVGVYILKNAGLALKGHLLHKFRIGFAIKEYGMNEY